jgi:tRNA (guanine37-N1)-methyltransferase
MNLKDLLKQKFRKDELESLRKSFDIIGDVAIIEIPPELKNREKEIVESLRKIHKHIKTIYKKESEREGIFRLRDLKLIYGKERETIHKEHGCKFLMNVKKVYFSPRESTERQRVADQVKARERVMVMFAGIGPYPIVIAKKQPRVSKVYAIEINPHAFKYMVENIRINKVQEKVIPILGDVKDRCPRYFGMCDRVVMPLPKGAYEYLSLAIQCLKPKGGYVHFYYWGPKDDFKEAEDIVKFSVEKLGKKAKILRRHKVLPYKPKIWKICLDTKVYKS